MTCVADNAGAAAGVSVELGEDQARELDPLVELGGCIHGVLAGHGVEHHQDLGGVEDVPHLLQLFHEGLVGVDSSPGVHDGPLHAHLARPAQAVHHHSRGRVRFCVLTVDGDVQLPAERFELVNRRGPPQVSGDEERALLAFAQQQRQLGGGRRLAGALQAYEHEHSGERRAGSERVFALAKKLDELVVHQFDDLLPRGDAAQDIAVGGPLLHLRREVARDPEVNVRLQQGEAHFAQRLVDVLVGEASLVPRCGRRRR